MNRDTVAKWAEAYRVAWESADSEAVATLFSEDATYRSEIYEEPHQGRQGVIDYWTGVTSAQSEVSVVMGDPFIDGDRAVVEFWARMRINDDPVTLAGALILDFADDGLCTALREYWNFTGGIEEPPEGWGS